MRQNLYLFSDSILRRKNNTLYLEAKEDKRSRHEADIDEDEIDAVLIGEKDKEKIIKKKFVPAQNVESVFTFGEIGFTSQFLGCLAEYYIPMHSFNYYGNYIGSFFPKDEINSGNIALAQAHNFFDEDKRLYIAKNFIKGAAENSLSNLKYYSYRGVELSDEMIRIRELINSIDIAYSVGSLMGTEGNIKSIYYECWKKIFRQEVEFERRVKNPPDNMINSLISFGNMMMYSVCLNEIYRTGLIPSIGYLHSPGDNRLPLSYDIAEIFKPVITDKVIFRLINLEIIRESDFERKGKILFMNEKAKRKYVDEFEERMKTTIIHPSLKRSVSYRTIIRLECYNLIKYLREGKTYESFRIRI
ncbi:MAG TPA: type I-B CRISPR-associated endonuclease Cas1b [Ignavibacteria bacterium]|nr:type I-B CRISPR-associated endonuclease Cas1b [Ignavibacteria bacterium]HRK00476.1 type I-B CRISPR-associated endonuclease Cas1b [Ignavibacteria bacterium]